MSKKQLNTADVMDELKHGSVFFQQKSNPNETEQSNIEIPPAKSNHDPTLPRSHDTTVSRYHATIVERVRKAVKTFGKEAATHRFTIEEKQIISDVVYSYKRQGVRTSENEITRIAINFVINDHLENGENSILNLVLNALNE